MFTWQPHKRRNSCRNTTSVPQNILHRWSTHIKEPSSSRQSSTGGLNLPPLVREEEDTSTPLRPTQSLIGRSASVTTNDFATSSYSKSTSSTMLAASQFTPPPTTPTGGRMFKYTAPERPSSGADANNNNNGAAFITAYFTEVGGRDHTLVMTVTSRQLCIGELIGNEMRAQRLDVHMFKVFVDKSATPLPLSSPAYYLSGQRVHVVACHNINTEQPRRGVIAVQHAKGRSVDSTTSSSPPSSSVTNAPPSCKGVDRKASLQMQHHPSFQFNKHDTKTRGKITMKGKARMAGGGSVSAAQSPCLAASTPVDDVNGGADTLNSARRARSTTRLASIFNRSTVSEMLAKLDAFKEAGYVSHVNIELQRESVAPELTALETDWRHIVANSEALTRKQCEQQAAIWEMVTSEQSFLLVLSELTDLQHYMTLLQQDGHLPNIDTGIVFLNIVDIYRTNIGFWNHAIEPLLAAARATGGLLDAAHLTEPFARIAQWCQPYIAFNVAYERTHAYIRKKREDSDDFKAFVNWAQTTGGHRLGIDHHMARVMQRMTKYHLLLSAVLMPTRDPPLCLQLQHMIENAKDAASRVNVELCHHKQMGHLHMLMTQMEAYEPVDMPAKDDELQRFVRDMGGRLDLTAAMPFCPNALMRSLMHRGDMKLREGNGKAVDVHVMLFTDMLLVCKRRANDKYRVIRAPMNVDRIIVRELNDYIGMAIIYMNEFAVMSTVFTMYAVNADDVTRWIEFIAMAQEEYRKCRHAPFIMAGEPLTRSGNAAQFMTSSNTLTPDTIAKHDRRISVGSLLDPTHRTALASTSATHLSTNDGVYATAAAHTPIVHRKSISMDNDSTSGVVEPPALQSSHSTSDIVATAVRPTQLVPPTDGDDGDDGALTPTRHDVQRQPTVQVPPATRRSGGERRYYTADRIDEMKAKDNTTILKRLSMNVTSRSPWKTNSKKVAADSRKTSNTTTMSNESFSSSGVSSSGSHQHISHITIHATPPPCVLHPPPLPDTAPPTTSTYAIVNCALVDRTSTLSNGDDEVALNDDEQEERDVQTATDVAPLIVCEHGDEHDVDDASPILEDATIVSVIASRQHLIDMLPDDDIEISDV